MMVTLIETTRRRLMLRGFVPRGRTAAFVAALILLCGALCSSTAIAQHGGGPPGGGGGMMGGPPPGNGMMGNQPHMRDMGRLPSPRITIPRPMRSGPQLGLTGRWWDDGKTVKKIGLRNDQQRRMDEIFESNKPILLDLYNNLQREEARLVSLPPGDLQDESKVFAAIDRVSVARTELEKENAHILLQIRQQMEPQQIAVLDKEIADAP